MSRLRDVWWAAALFLVCGIGGAWWVHRDIGTSALSTHGDQIWIHASAQVAMQSGPFAVNEHLGWFSGFDPWAFPTLGSLGFYVVAWFLGLFIANSSMVLALIMGLVAAVVGVSVFGALRVVPVRSVHPAVAFVLALAFGLSPYVLGKLGHINVAAWYLIPLVFIALAVLQRGVRGRWLIAMFVVLFIAALLSPLWWLLIALYGLVLGLVAALLLRAWPWVQRVLVVFAVLLAGGALPIGLSIARRVPEGTWNREQWDSTFFGGSFVDFLVASPWLRSVLPALGDLTPGAARELSMVGLVPAVLALALLAIVITAFRGLGSNWQSRGAWLLVAAQVVILSFLTMGLGTFQEALLALGGVESPLRVWARLSIVVAFLGALFVAPWLSERVFGSSAVRGRIGAVLLGVVVLAVVALDAVSIESERSPQIAAIPEAPAVEYLAGEVGDCPVAQLPVGTFPDFPMWDGNRETILNYYYRGFLPYLLNPEGTWSFGAAAGTPSDEFMRALPVQLSGSDWIALGAAGYCAVLFDRQAGEWLAPQGWAGSVMPGVAPDWTGDRFDVFLLPS